MQPLLADIVVRVLDLELKVHLLRAIIGHIEVPYGRLVEPHHTKLNVQSVCGYLRLTVVLALIHRLEHLGQDLPVLLIVACLYLHTEYGIDRLMVAFSYLHDAIVLQLLDEFALPQDAIAIRRRALFFARVIGIGAHVVFVGGRKLNLSLRVALKASLVAHLRAQLIVLQHQLKRLRVAHRARPLLSIWLLYPIVEITQPENVTTLMERQRTDKTRERERERDRLVICLLHCCLLQLLMIVDSADLQSVLLESHIIVNGFVVVIPLRHVAHVRGQM